MKKKNVKSFFMTLKRVVNSKVVVLLSMMTLFALGTMKVANADVNYEFANAFQYFMLDNRADQVKEGAQEKKAVHIASLGSGGVTGSFSYSEIVNSAPGTGKAKEKNKKTAEQFVTEMATYSTFNYFSNRIQGFESITPTIGRFVAVVLIPFAILVDFLGLILPSMLNLLAKLNVIPLLGAAITNLGVQSNLFQALSITKEQVNTIVNIALSVSTSFILIAVFMTLRRGGQNIDRRWLKRLEGRLFTIICLPLVVGFSATLLNSIGDLASTAPVMDSSNFSNYLIDVRSWAYNYNFAPNGNSASASDLKATKGYVDLDFNPYTDPGQARIKQINSKSSIVGDGSIFPNTSLMLAFVTSSSFSATDYINYQGSEESKQNNTYGSYYDYANNYTNKKLVDIEKAYVPSSGQTYGNKTDQNGPYKSAINDYKVDGKDTLNTSKVTAWRDRFIYGAKNAGDLNKYYGESPSQEMVKNMVGGTKSSTIPSDQSMFLILSTIFDETGGRYYVSAPSRGAYSLIGKFDSNRSDYYTVSMVGEPLFTVFALLGGPLINLVCLLAAVVALFSVGFVEMNVRPLSTWLKGLFIGDIEYSEAFIIYSLGISGTVAVYTVMPSLIMGFFNALSSGVVKTIPTVAGLTPTSPQQSLAYHGVPKIIAGCIAILMTVLYFKSEKFRNTLNEVYTFVWNWALEAGDRLERSINTQIAQDRDKAKMLGAKTERYPFLENANKLDNRFKAWSNRVRGLENDPEELPNGGEMPISEHEEQEELNGNPYDSRTERPKGPSDIKRDGQIQRAENALDEVIDNPDISDELSDKASDAQNTLDELKKNPSTDAITDAQNSLHDLRDQLVSDGASDEAIAAVDRALDEINEVGQDQGLDMDRETKPANKQNDTGLERLIHSPKITKSGLKAATIAQSALSSLEKNPTKENLDRAQQSLRTLKAQMLKDGASPEEIAAVDKALGRTEEIAKQNNLAVDNVPSKQAHQSQGEMSQIANNPNISGQSANRALLADQAIKNLQERPTKENLANTQQNLKTLRKQLVAEGASPESIAAVDRALTKVNKVGQDSGLVPNKVKEQINPKRTSSINGANKVNLADTKQSLSKLTNELVKGGTPDSTEKALVANKAVHAFEENPTKENLGNAQNSLRTLRSQLVKDVAPATDIATVDRAISQVSHAGRSQINSSIVPTQRVQKVGNMLDSLSKTSKLSKESTNKVLATKKALNKFENNPSKENLVDAQRSLQNLRGQLTRDGVAKNNITAVNTALRNINQMGKAQGLTSPKRSIKQISSNFDQIGSGSRVLHRKAVETKKLLSSFENKPSTQTLNEAQQSLSSLKEQLVKSNAPQEDIATVNNALKRVNHYGNSYAFKSTNSDVGKQNIPDRLIRHNDTMRHRVISNDQLRGVVASLGKAAKNEKVVSALKELKNSSNTSDVKRNVRRLQKVVRALDNKEKQKINKKIFIKMIYDLNNGGNK
ncbi:hypothetical protein [Lactobacillus hominis]|uniref:hypothetical protein n=1 Tax=Lactobacillus hominis TaxID=1203033 RepID=UPI00260FAFBB|nr:hypothetical protein [Lactobacillus hominis]